MLYEIKNGTVSLGGNEILSHFSFRMVDNEKIGIVGRNGAGKTTLLRLMNGEIELDYNDDNTRGEIVKSKDFNPGYLRQQLAGATEGSQASPLQDTPLQETTYSYLLEAFNKLIEMEQKIEKLTNEIAENYDEKKAVELNTLIDTYNFEGGNIYIKELKTGFKKFGFNESDLEKPLNEFSGGQSTKISLLKLLLSKPDVLILDEPTNHLDIEAIEWMENYLQGYMKNIVVVSHDRMFLDNICNVIYDVENRETVRYDGNYTDFVQQKEINYQLKLAEYNKNLKEIERLTALADRFRYKATKAKMVQSKDKVIEKLEAKTFKPMEADTKTFHVKIVPNKVGGKEVLRCTDLVVGYNKGSYNSPVQGTTECRPLQDSSVQANVVAKVNLVVNRGDRLAVIGANGTGKSTFTKTIVGVLPKISGEYSYGHEIEFEYFDQRIAENNSIKTLFDDFSDEFPTYDNTEVRNRLGRFLFGEEDISKRVCDLSGGEKVRLCLAKIFERKPNLLILDEPTNHLDILGKESLEEIINNFEGTVIFVSHDRYFVKKISTKVLFFEERAHTKFFEFGYADYEKYVKEKELSEAQDTRDVNTYTNANLNTTAKDTRGKKSYIESKQKNKDDKKIKKLEEEIAKLEKELEVLKTRLEDSSIQSNFEELSAIQKEIDEKNSVIMVKYEMWEKLQ
ncbi:MAG: ABC-F family ATP-binding cassette domain-containing protein [Lachnospiraceae bacterium]|nr:ABC-F family ATP-binding cassette domain-containing protein [Lachnospiraceae bacterium]